MAVDHFLRYEGKTPVVDWNFNIDYRDQPEVAAMAEKYATVLRNVTGLHEPIPANWLHTTVLRIGLVSDYTEHEVLAMADVLASRMHDVKLPQFVFDPWWLWDGNVVLHISPEDAFMPIHEIVRQSVTDIVGPERTAQPKYGRYIPHMTLAYTKSHHHEQEIHDILETNLVASARFRATNLVLIRQQPIRGRYEWEAVRTVPIGK